MDEAETVNHRYNTDRVAWTAFGIILLAVSAYLIHLGAGTTFFRDELTFLQYRDGHDLTNFMSSHDGQQVPGQALVYLFLFKVFGLSDYIIYRLATLPLFLACCGFIYYFAKRRMGRWGAIPPAVLILSLGASYTDILWPLAVMGFAGAICFGLFAFLAIEKRTLVGDATASVSLLIALSFSGVALPFLAGVAVGLFSEGGRFWKRLWIPGVPAFAYLLWSQIYGTQKLDLGSSIGDAPNYLSDLAVNAIYGLSGLPWTAATVASLLLLVSIFIRLTSFRDVPTLAWQATAALLSFWVLTTIARQQSGDPLAVRYIFPSVLLIVLILVALAPTQRYQATYAVCFAVVVLAVMPHGLRSFGEGSASLRRSATITKAELGAAEIGRVTISPEQTLSLREYPVEAGAYFGAIDRYESSPAFDPNELMVAPDYSRLRADTVLSDAQGIVRTMGSVEASRSAPAGRSAYCRRIRGGQSIEIDNLVRTSATVFVSGGQADIWTKRFADEFQSSKSGRSGEFPSVISAPPDLVGSPAWQGLITAVSGHVKVCIERRGDRP